MSQIKSFLPPVLSLTHTLFPPFPLSPLSLFPHPVAPTFPTPFSPCSKVSDFQNQPYKIHFFLLSAQVFNSHSFSPSPSWQTYSFSAPVFLSLFLFQLLTHSHRKGRIEQECSEQAATCQNSESLYKEQLFQSAKLAQLNWQVLTVTGLYGLIIFYLVAQPS